MVSGLMDAVIAKGSVVTANNGQRYQTQTEVSLKEINQVIKIEALLVGIEANCENQKAKWETTISGVSPDLMLSATGGTDTETDEVFRSRALDTIRNRGTLYGKRGDYRAWALDSTAEVTQAWEVPNFENHASLGVLVAGNNLASVSDGALENVRTTLTEKKLMGVLTEVLRAEIRRLEFSLAIVPDTPDLRLATENSVRTYIKDRQKPVAQIVLSKLKEYLQEHIEGLLSVAILEPSSDIQTSQREVPTLGIIKWR